MKRTLLFLTLLVIGFASCKKEDNYYGAYVPPYHIDGIRNLTVARSNGMTTADSMMLTVSYENSTQEKVSLSLTGAPAGVTASLSDTSGYPTFTSYVKIMVDTTAAPGTYQMTLHAHGATTGDKVFTFNLTVLPAPALNVYLIDTAYNSFDCNGTVFMQNITAGSTTSRIIFSNFDNRGNAVEAILSGDPNNGTLVIPSQTVNGVTYSSTIGNGGYSIDQQTGQRNIGVQFERTDSTGTNTCFVSLNK